MKHLKVVRVRQIIIGEGVTHKNKSKKKSPFPQIITNAPKPPSILDISKLKLRDENTYLLLKLRKERKDNVII